MKPIQKLLAAALCVLLLLPVLSGCSGGEQRIIRIGNITPPVGNTLFVTIKVGKTTLAKTIPYMLWYYAAILIGLLLVTYVSALSMGLPTLAGLV